MPPPHADLLPDTAANPPGPAATGFAVSAVECPFPVTPVYEVRADLQKLDDAPLLIEDADWPQWVRHKRARLAQAGALQRAPDLDDGRLAGLAQAVAAALYTRVPQGPVDAGGALPWAGLPAGLPPADFLLGLTLSLQEDLVLMARDSSGEFSAKWLSVCFPSGWRPAEKLGQSMFSIHAPVADNARLQQSAGSLAQAMASKGPFVRHVWTLSGSSILHKDPGDDVWSGVQSRDDLWFRCERQVTVPLGGEASLFLIRVFVAPLRVVAHSPERQALLTQALASMSEAVVQYKGLQPALPLFGLQHRNG